MNNITRLVSVLPIWKVDKKTFNKGKNDIIHTRLEYINELHDKKIISIVIDVDANQSQICFCTSCICLKIMYNPSKKPMSEIIRIFGSVRASKK